MLKNLGSGGSFAHVVGQEVLNELLGVVTDKAPLIIVHVHAALGDLLENLVLGLAVEGRVPTQHNVQNHSHAPNIRLFIRVPLENFGSDVVGSAAFLVESFFVGKVAGCAEIDYCNSWIHHVPAHQDVLRLYVSVHHLPLVAVVQR